MLPYERRLVAWQLRRWRANHGHDVESAERESGAEYVRLLAAYTAARLLMTALFVVSFVVSVSLATVFWPGIFIGLGIVGLAAVVGCIGLVRSYQSDNARKEYEQTRPLTPQ